MDPNIITFELSHCVFFPQVIDELQAENRRLNVEARDRINDDESVGPAPESR